MDIQLDVNSLKTGNTLGCVWWFFAVKKITMYVVEKNYLSIFSNISEAFDSELLENLNKCFLVVSSM